MGHNFTVQHRLELESHRMSYPQLATCLEKLWAPRTAWEA